MTAQEIIDALPKAVLMWYPFEENKEIAVIEREEQICNLATNVAYIVIASSAIEQAKRPEELLVQAKNCLESNGRLFILMNNRLGIRYFSGDKDPYTKTVGDCLEDYKNMNMKAYDGRLYDRAQMEQFLNQAGISDYQFYSLFSDLTNPSLIFAEDYVPNEDITNRLVPSYHSQKTVFLDERSMYKQLVANGMLHKMANAYMVECSLNGELSDVLHVTSSLERGEKDALFTIIHRNHTVEKKAAYPEGIKRLQDIDANIRKLAANGVPVVKGELRDDSYVMEYIEAETTQVYLEKLLRKDVELFLKEMDHFRDVLLTTSKIVKEDAADGLGAVLEEGFFDLVPLNSFHIGDEFVFYDQEFCEQDYPANNLIWRMIATYYSADLWAERICPREDLIKRYNLGKYSEKWRRADTDFLKLLRKEEELENYHRHVWADGRDIWRNRQWMNEPIKYHDKFYDIFDGVEGKKLILFGTGRYTKRFMEDYGKDYPIDAMLDNSSDKVGTKAYGVPIESPDYLKSLVYGTYKVIICIKDYESVAEQLEAMGIFQYSIYNPRVYYLTRPRTTIEVLDDRSLGEPKKYHVGYVAGAFDMFHVGHINLLRRAKEQCDYLIVGVMSDEKMTGLKHKAPVIPCHERMQVVAACKYVDRVEELPADRASIKSAFNLFHFDCMFSGNDHVDSKDWQEDIAFLKERGADVVFFPYTEGQSSSEIRKKLPNA